MPKATFPPYLYSQKEVIRTRRTDEPDGAEIDIESAISDGPMFRLDDLDTTLAKKNLLIADWSLSLLNVYEMDANKKCSAYTTISKSPAWRVGTKAPDIAKRDFYYREITYERI